jgi:hypothetical protein
MTLVFCCHSLGKLFFALGSSVTKKSAVSIAVCAVLENPVSQYVSVPANNKIVGVDLCMDLNLRSSFPHR